jgi:CheY-like chemotaxis protein
MINERDEARTCGLAEPAANPAASGTDEAPATWRILVVEDVPSQQKLLVKVLSKSGHSVATADSGREAIDLVEREPFDIVLMDVQMPGMSGHEAARELRKRFDSMQLPIIALTAAALVSERDQALASGMNEFLTKPIDAKRLKDTLARCIARQFAH